MIVKPLNVVKDISAGLCSGSVLPPMDSLSFEEAKETLRHRIVITVPPTPLLTIPWALRKA
jgi:hypothetical protein